MENTSKHTKLSTKIRTYSSMEHRLASSIRYCVYVVIVKLPFHNSITHTDEWVMSNVEKDGWYKYGVRVSMDK